MKTYADRIREMSNEELADFINCGLCNRCTYKKSQLCGFELCKKGILEYLNKKVEILDSTEKKYLESVLRPFKDKVRVIKKIPKNAEKNEFIMIEFFSKECGCEIIYFPYFKQNTMYKGMELHEEYTPHDLGLFE